MKRVKVIEREHILEELEKFSYSTNVDKRSRLIELLNLEPPQTGADQKSSLVNIPDAAVTQSTKELMSGGFGEVETFRLTEDCEDMVSRFLSNTSRALLLQVSEEIVLDTAYIGEVFGIGREETGRYYLLEKNEDCARCSIHKAFSAVGIIVPENIYQIVVRDKSIEFKGYQFFGAYVNGEWMFHRLDSQHTYMTMMTFSMVAKLFSRNTGLLESECMLAKTAVIVGCGSVGALVALELARAGVGRFVLIDGDILEIHNICRHQLGFRDLGRFKTEAVLEAIHNINPGADVKTFCGTLQDMPEEMLENLGEAIIVGTGDNRESSAVANDLAAKFRQPFVATGCWNRAHAGEVFYWYPDSGLPLYREAFRKLITDERPKAHEAYFGDETDAEKLNFEPGISSDIGFVTSVALKIILDLLNKNSYDYTVRVLDYLTNYTLICNTNKTAIGGDNAAIFPHPLFISNTIHMNSGKRENDV